MPNQLSPSKKRITYTEFKDVFDRLDRYAASLRMDRSFVIRTATQSFVTEFKNKRWKAAPYKSPDTKGVRRITYAEWTDVVEVIQEIATAERSDFSDLIRAAVHTYLTKVKA